MKNISRGDLDNLPNQLRRYRLKRCLRLRDVANLLDLDSPAHVAHWEKGRKQPSLSNILNLSAILQCPAEILFLDNFNQSRKRIYEKRQQLGLSPLTVEDEGSPGNAGD